LKILEWITECVPNSLWLAYEQCNINDPFGQVMVSHFLKNGSPLLSLLSAQSKEDQELQLTKAVIDKLLMKEMFYLKVNFKLMSLSCCVEFLSGQSI
jgi:hypothetical protein